MENKPYENIREFLYPNRFWAGYARFFSPYVFNEVGLGLMHNLDIILSSNSKEAIGYSIKQAIKTLSCRHARATSAGGEYCYPTSDANILIEMLKDIQGDIVENKHCFDGYLEYVNDTISKYTGIVLHDKEIENCAEAALYKTLTMNPYYEINRNHYFSIMGEEFKKAIKNKLDLSIGLMIAEILEKKISYCTKFKYAPNDVSGGRFGAVFYGYAK